MSGTWQLDDSGHVSPTAATDGILAVMTLPTTVAATSYTLSMDVVIAKSGSQSNQGAPSRPVSGGTDWQLYRVVNGGHTCVFQFGMAAIPAGNTATLRVDVFDRDITVWLNGTEIYTVVEPRTRARTSSASDRESPAAPPPPSSSPTSRSPVTPARS